MSLQIGERSNGEPIYMWELPQSALREAARRQKARDDMHAAHKALDNHEVSLARLFSGRLPDLPSRSRLTYEVRLAEMRYAAAMKPAPSLEDMPSVISEAAKAIERFGQAFRDAEPYDGKGES